MIFKFGESDSDRSMKFVLAVFAILQGVLFGDAMEVRSYRVSMTEFAKAYRIGPRMISDEDLSGPKVGELDGLGRAVEKPSFESRFFEEGGTWRECSKRVAEVLQDVEFSGTALMDRNKGVLVMRAAEGDHENFATMVRAELPRQLRMAVAIYEVPGVVSGMRSVGFAKEAEGVELLGEVSLVALPGQTGQAQTAGGELKVETEMQIDMNDGIVEVRATIAGKPRGVEFSMRSGLTIPLGMPWDIELGAVTGGKSVVMVVMVVTVDLILLDGTREDSWVLKEKGGEFLRERRLRGMKSNELREQEGEFRKYSVPPTFLTFIMITPAGGDGEGYPDPFAVGPEEVRRPNNPPVYRGRHKELAGIGRVYDIGTLLKQNGISFREGDFAVFSKLKGRIYAKLSVVSQELLAGITNWGGPNSPRMIRFDFEQVDNEGVILKKLGGLALPGQTATVSLGADLKVELEAQIDANSTIVETRFKLAESGSDLERPTLETGVTLRDGISSVVQTTFSGEKKSWKLTAHSVAVDEVVGSYLEGSK